MGQKKDANERSWFVTWDNPQESLVGLSPEEMTDEALKMWTDSHEVRVGAISYCVSAQGLIHFHMILEDPRKCRFSAIKKVYPSAHIQATKGNKKQALAYLRKEGEYAEKGEIVVCVKSTGDIQGNQGKRTDLDYIGELIESGYTPREIMNMNFGYRKYEKLIKDGFFSKRRDETPLLRDIECVWHCGESGSGKTYSYIKACEKYGEDDVYLLTDYDNGGLDNYCGEYALFLDEFRGQIRYSTLLGMLQGYKQQFHARYTNITGLWREVHICTVLPPEKVYSNMVEKNRDDDSIAQLMRRISKFVYHWKDEHGYHQYECNMSDYKSYEDIVALIKNNPFKEEKSNEN